MEKVISVAALPDYRIEVEFSDGVRGIVSLEGRLEGPLFGPLRDKREFAKVSIDEFGAVCWPNGADLAPDAMHDRLQRAQRVA